MNVIKVTFFILLIVSACSKYPKEVSDALKKSGNNRQELTKAIQHFSESPKDSLRLKAAYYLIGNMPRHRYRKKSKIFESAFDSASTHTNSGERANFFRSEMDRIKKKNTYAFYKDSLIYDLKHVTGDFLIQNINLAFKAYNRIPKEVRPGLNKFYHYVLPYRASGEPLEFNTRAKQYERYKWVYKKMRLGKTVPDIVDDIIDSTNIMFSFETRYPGIFSTSQIDKVHFGNCTDAVNYMVNVFRSVGIPASIDFTPHWGNVPNHGHSWLSVITKDSVLTIDAFSKEKITKINNQWSMPKIYRYTYNNANAFPPFTKDVTALYKPLNKINIKNLLNKNGDIGEVYLTVFDKRTGWFPVAQSESKNRDGYMFSDVAQNVPLLAGYYNGNDFHPINYPFLVNDRNNPVYFRPNKKSTIDSAVILRKFPPYFKRRKYVRLKWVQTMGDLKLQAAQTSSFFNPKGIRTFKNFNSTHLKTIPLHYKGKYKFYRLIGPDTSAVYLSELGIKSEVDNYKVNFSSSRSDKYKELLKNQNPLTWQGGDRLNVAFTFPEPQKITSIQLQPRNDDNDINKGDRYELMYWDKGWKSLSKKTASDTLLVYHNLPGNALFWLRNLSRGKEEEVFRITDSGEQKWPGVPKNVSFSN